MTLPFVVTLLTFVRQHELSIIKERCWRYELEPGTSLSLPDPKLDNSTGDFTHVISP